MLDNARKHVDRYAGKYLFGTSITIVVGMVSAGLAHLVSIFFYVALACLGLVVMGILMFIFLLVTTKSLKTRAASQEVTGA